jgi:hypothetical protein
MTWTCSSEQRPRVAGRTLVDHLAALRRYHRAVATEL